MKNGNHIIKIGLIQMRSEKGAIDDNLKAISGYISEADKRGVDIIGFPEACITGYNNPAKYPEAIIRLDGVEIDAVLRMTKGRKITVLAGLLEENPESKPYITQIVIHDGKLAGYYRKQVNIDEDAEWFSSGDTVKVFAHDDIRFGISICADISNEEVFAGCARQGAQIVFELAAPGLYGEQADRDWRAGYAWWEGECEKYLKGYAIKYGIWIAVATQAGRTVDEDFPGGGYLYAPDGRRLYATPDGNPGAAYLSLDMKNQEVTGL